MDRLSVFTCPNGPVQNKICSYFGSVRRGAVILELSQKKSAQMFETKNPSLKNEKIDEMS